MSESVRQALHKQKAACRAAAQLSTAELGQQQASSCKAQQEEESEPEPHSFVHAHSTAQPHVTVRPSALVASAGPLLDSVSEVRQAGLAANMPLPPCHQHGLETQGAAAASKLGQAANSHTGLAEADMQVPNASLPVESVGSEAVTNLSLQQSGERKRRVKASGDVRPQLWQVRLHPLCLHLQHSVVCLAVQRQIAVEGDDVCDLTVCYHPLLHLLSDPCIETSPARVALQAVESSKIC